MDNLTLSYSLADQSFNQTKSVGIFNLSIQLLENLARRLHSVKLSVFSNSTLDGKLQLPPEVDIRYHNEAIHSKIARMIWDQWGVYEAAKKSGNQWLFLPKGFSSFLRPYPLKLAVYSHDAIHDFYRVNYPKVIPLAENQYFSQCLKYTLKYSSIIFTNSDFAKNELERLASCFRIKVPLIITAGIGFTRILESHVVKRDSLLVLTSTWPHKLTRKAISYIERWQRETGFLGRVDLVGDLPVDIRLPDLASWYHHTRLPEVTYRKFLAESKVLLFFSAYEGFGMPPVEAMIAGTCPVYSDLPVTREVMGARGFSFSNDSYDSFAQAMNRALNVSERQVQLWGNQLLEHHNWDKVVERIYSGLAQCGKEGSL
jgi:glycosyltransferase involved in cell wall biosynthesis